MAENKHESLRHRPQTLQEQISDTSESLQNEKLQKKISKTNQNIDYSSLVGIVLALILVFAVIHFADKPSISARLWNKEELAKYNGTNEESPILLSILGSVFDVSRGRTHYGVGGSYNHFAGRDATRAFITGNFTEIGLTDNVKGLSSTEIKSIVDWRDFYHKSYLYVGKLVGRYYDVAGEPTKELKGVESKAARGVQLLAKRKAEEDKLPNCNSKWSQESGSEVWCDSGFPRIVQMPSEIAIAGKVGRRCACFKADELNQPGLELYEGCDPSSTRCKLPKHLKV